MNFVPAGVSATTCARRSLSLGRRAIKLRLSSSAITGAAPATISYGSGITTLQLSLGSGADLVGVTSTLSGTATTIFGNGGADVFSVGSAGNSLDNIAGALTVNLGAYATEIVRAGIEAIHKSQIEAGLSLGMSRLQVFRYVVLFPALKVIYPALASQFILLMLATSIVSLIAAQDLFHMAAFLESRTFRSFEIYLVVTGLYLVMALFFRAAFGVVYHLAFERR